LPYYESVLIARQDISAAQVEGLIESFGKVITDNGGTVAKTEFWGLRNLAYRIKKNRKGHYVLLNLDAPAPAVHEVERQLRLNEDILRYLTIRVDQLEEGPSVVMNNKDRDERPRRDFGDQAHGPRPPREDSPVALSTKTAKPGEPTAAKPETAKPETAKPEETETETPKGDDA